MCNSPSCLGPKPAARVWCAVPKTSTSTPSTIVRGRRLHPVADYLLSYTFLFSFFPEALGTQRFEFHLHVSPSFGLGVSLPLSESSLRLPWELPWMEIPPDEWMALKPQPGSRGGRIPKRNTNPTTRIELIIANPTRKLSTDSETMFLRQRRTSMSR